MSRHSKLDLPIAAILLLSAIAYAAQTKIRLTTQVVDSVSQGYLLAGPISGAATTPTFRPYTFGDITAFAGIGSGSWGQCLPTGSSVNCIGENADATEADVTATSTLPTYTNFTSDTTGATCFDYPDTGAFSWYTGRNLTVTAYAAVSHTTGILAQFGNYGGSDLSNCGVQFNNTHNSAHFLISSAHAGSNVRCISTDADGVNVEDTDSLVPYDTDFHTWRIWYDNANAQVKFYIDDMTTPVCTNSTQIPVNIELATKFMIYCDSCGGVARTWKVAWHEMTTTPF